MLSSVSGRLLNKHILTWTLLFNGTIIKYVNKTIMNQTMGETMNINNIYAGKPDASDEIRERGYEEFANNYIEPSGVNIERLASTEYGTPFFIMGDKGTGKTALLHFLENYVRTLDPQACSSFISFENSFTQVQKEKFNAISQSISTSISIDRSIASIGQSVECDFTYIWKWQLYQKIIKDHEELNNGIFVCDDNWEKFVTEISRISKTIDKTQMNLPAKISVTMTANPQLGTFTPGLNIEPVDFSQRNFNVTKGYKEFVKIIDRADLLVQSIARTDIPYYIFIDELEAYRGEGDTFYRDLRMIRDLLFTVKRMNDIFQSGTKFICSVRLEIINAINRFVQSKQLHKIMQGYDERLIWEYTNTNSFNHPIIRVLLRRIQIAEEKLANHPVKQDELIQKWFVTNVYNTHICTYILDNTWHKPRDIVRLLLSAQSKDSKNSTIFNQHTFETFMPVYSKQCLVEVREEMQALYTASEIEEIFNCLQGFKVSFSYTEISERVKRLYPDSIFAKETHTVLNDMYRIGVIGNILSNDLSSRWAHKEQYSLFIDEPWKIIIHSSLRIELSVSGRIDKHINKKLYLTESYKDTNIYTAQIKKIRYRYIIVSFEKDGCIQSGYVGMGNLGIPGLEEGLLNTHFKVGEFLKLKILKYDYTYANWRMCVI